MGLSNQERYSKMAFAVNTIVQTWKEILGRHKFSDETVNKWQPYIDELWPLFIKTKGTTGSYWLLGSGLTDPAFKEGYLPHLAMLNRINVAEEDAEKKEADEYSKKLHKSKNTKAVEEYAAVTRFSELHDYFNHNFSMVNSVGKIYDGDSAHIEAFWVMTLLTNIEFFNYGLHRYEDDFYKSFAALEKQMNRIFGECFNELTKNDIYLKAYLLDNIGRKVITYDHKDPLNKLATSHYYYHKITNTDNYEIDKLLSIWKKIQFKEINIQERLIIFLYLIKHSIASYDKDDILEALATWDIKDKAKVIKEVTLLINKYMAVNEKRNNPKSKYGRHSYCLLTNNGG